MLQKEKTCCFTGHRPEKLNLGENEIVLRLKTAIKQAINEGYTTFVSGMAQGIDIWAAECVIEEKMKNKEIKLCCALPYGSFGKGKTAEQKNLYKKILDNADYIKVVCENYSKSCFQLRNIFMVDMSSKVIAAYNGCYGGTRNTVNYAEKKGVNVVNILSGS